MSIILGTLFDDKRLTCVILVVWTVIVLSIFSHMGIMHTQFMSFGPSPTTEFMGIALHTWPRWSCVAIFTFMSTAINDFVGDAVVPWIQNTIQDHKTRYIPYSKLTCWSITQIWSLYCCIMSIFSIYLLMSQIDFLLIRAFADTLVNSYTTYRFLQYKKHNQHKYNDIYGKQKDKSDSDSDIAQHETVSQVFALAESPKHRNCNIVLELHEESTQANETDLDVSLSDTMHNVSLLQHSAIASITRPVTPSNTPKMSPRGQGFTTSQTSQ